MIEIDGVMLTPENLDTLIQAGKVDLDGTITWSGPAAYTLNYKGKLYDVDKLIAVVDASLEIHTRDCDAIFDCKLCKALEALDEHTASNISDHRR